MKILGVIPARAGSKRILGKNRRMIQGQPMITYTISAAMHSTLDDFVITTDDTHIMKLLPENTERRPPELCQDDTPMIKVLQYVVEQHPGYDAICLLQPTSPLRTKDDINNAVELFKTTAEQYKVSPLYSGYFMPLKTKDKPYNGEKHFQRNGAIFITPVELIKQGKLWDDSVVEYEMPFSQSIDIDTEDDWFVAEAIMEKMGREG